MIICGLKLQTSTRKGDYKFIKTKDNNKEISNMKHGIYYLTVHSDQKLKTLKLVLL